MSEVRIQQSTEQDVPQSIVIVGAGGSGRCVLDVIEKINVVEPATWRFQGYVDDDSARDPIAPLEDLVALDVNAYAISIANPEVRRRVDLDAPAPAVLVHPSAVLAQSSPPKPGLVVRGNATVGPDVRFGRHNYISMNATVGHDVVMHNYVTVHPGANISGFVRVEEGATFGAGSVVLPSVTIGAYAYVGAGAVVTKDVPPGATVTGAPARQR